MVREEIVTKPHELKVVCRQLLQTKIFGFDTEFVGETTYHPILCLIQVSTPEALYLIDPQSVGPLSEFWELVNHPDTCVVVHAGREEVRLCKVASGKPPGQCFDVQLAAGLVGLNYPMSHANLVSELMGVQLQKSETLTDWRRRPLTDAQIRYAFDDVRYLLPLREQLASKLVQLQRLPWANEEFARLIHLVMDDQRVLERWRKLPGLGKLNGRQLAIARDLFAWREARAEELQKPIRVICRDEILVEIARREPHQLQELASYRGLAKRDWSEILEVIRKTRQSPTSSWPSRTIKEPEPPQLNMLVPLLQAILTQLGQVLSITPNMIANVSDLRMLAHHFLKNRPLPDEQPLARGWRAQHIRPILENVLRGKLAMRLKQPVSELTIEFLAHVNEVSPFHSAPKQADTVESKPPCYTEEDTQTNSSEQTTCDS